MRRWPRALGLAWVLFGATLPACATIISSDDLHRVDCVGTCALEGDGDAEPARDASNDAADASADSRPLVDVAGEDARSTDTSGDIATQDDSSLEASGPDVSIDGADATIDSRPPQDASSDVVDAASDRSDAPACMDLSSGLVAHWTMDTSAANQIPDVSGNQNPGMLMGFVGAPLVPGKVGYALSFPASGTAYMHVPTLALDKTGGAANSISFWFYRDATAVDDVLALLPNSPRYDLWLTQATTHTYLCINTAGGECFGLRDDGLTGRWVHVVAVFANGPITNGKLYVDGVDRQAACVTDPGFNGCAKSATASAPVDFGGVTDFPFHGKLDDVRVYRRALTAGEVKVLSAGTACP